jgi:hypothetical protein
MDSQVVVWNSDARHKPELEVELELVTAPLDIPGFYLARLATELEVELIVLDQLEDAWFLSDDEIVALDDYTVYDPPPRGYAAAYAMAG